MRTTVDLPDSLFRKSKATAALRGSTLKQLIVQAERAKHVKLPLIQLPPTAKKVELTGFDFDDLPA